MRLAALASLMLLTACSSRYPDTCEPTFTLGSVQREICQGMSQDEVAIALGSPNIVTKDSGNNEVWIYDKIATEVRSSGTSGGIFLFLAGVQSSKAERSSTQKTLTVVIKFDQQQRVANIAYHSSKF